MLLIKRFLVVLLMTFLTVPALSQNFTKNLLVKDTRELGRLLESVHPDPYINCGGKIAFHRQLQTIMKSIPSDGMSINEYYNLLIPFVASIRDAHTSINLPKEQEQQAGLPFTFEVIDQALYISEVYYPEDEFLLGSKIHSIEDIPFLELLDRQLKLRGVENVYGNLYNLNLNLNSRNGLNLLLSECDDISTLRIKFEKPSGKIYEKTVGLSVELPDHTITPKTKINLPNTNQIDIGFSFLDQSTTLLCIDDMSKYRENFELLYSLGYLDNDSTVFKLYEKIQNKSPNNFNTAINGIPSATEIFLNLCREMKESKAKSLIIDLRKNSGGNDILTSFLLYFLYGIEKGMTSFQSSYNITKYSKEYFQTYKDDSLSNTNEGRSFPLVIGDYDFKDEDIYKLDSSNNVEKILSEYEKYFVMMPSFYNEYKTKTNEAIYKPEQIMILTSASTFSAGYSFAVAFYKLGVKILGTPSGQAGNCFIDILQFTLPNSSINCYISHKAMIMFPDDPEKGKVLMPDYLLTYDKLRSLNFDPNSEILYAQEILKNQL